MPAPSIGQPYNGTNNFSVGDPNSTAFADEAYQGVVVISMTAGYEEPTTILDDAESYRLRAYLKASNPFVGGAVASASVEFHIQPIAGGAVTVIGPYTPILMTVPPAPVGASATPGPWYQATTTTQAPLAAGTYRVLTLVTGTSGFQEWLAAFHEFILMVTAS